METNKWYVWTAEIAKNKNGKFDVCLYEEGSTGAQYYDLTPEEVGKILTEDIKAVNQVWEDDDKEEE